MVPASKKMRRKTPELPDDVIEDILARLPAKSVLRCRCLSRGWATVLSSGGFVDRHLDLANRGGNRLRWLSAWCREHPRVGLVTQSCRGLVVVHDYAAGVYYVCNPSTGQMASLPPADGTAPTCLGLGYADQQHKVVRFGGGGCQVYDVGGAGYWRRTAAKPPPCAVQATGVFVQGYVHWLAASGIDAKVLDTLISLSV